MLDPQAGALLALVESRALPPTHHLAPEEARAFYRERRRFTQPDPPALPEVRELRAPGPRGAIPVRLYRPAGAAPASGALVYFHGGGWVIGDLDTHDVLCRELALQAGCVVLSADYRLAPEHPFPAGLEDCLAALRWAREEAAALGIDATRLAVGGDSAGGNLAAVAAIASRGAPPSLRFQLLIYPATDMRATAPSHAANGAGYLLTADTVAYFRRHYVPDAALWDDWRVSPLRHADLAGLPPALVLTAGYDPLRDEGRQYADALSAAGSPAQYVCFERQIHGFVLMGRVLDEAHTAIALCAQALKRALA